MMRTTVAERIIIHLVGYRDEGSYEVPATISQAGIAKAVGIELKNISRTLKKLIQEGLILERKARLKGGRQRQKVYFLTKEGLEFAAKLETELNSIEIDVLEHGRVRKLTISELKSLLSPRPATIEIMKALDTHNMLDISDRKLIPITSDREPKDTLGDKVMAFTFLELGRLRHKKCDLDKAIEYFQKCLAHSHANFTVSEKLALYEELNSCYIEKKDWKNSIKYLQEQEQLAATANEKLLLANTWLKLAECWLKKGDRKNASEYASKALNGFQQLGDGEGVQKSRKIIRALT